MAGTCTDFLTLSSLTKNFYSNIKKKTLYHFFVSANKINCSAIQCPILGRRRDLTNKNSFSLHVNTTPT